MRQIEDEIALMRCGGYRRRRFGREGRQQLAELIGDDDDFFVLARMDEDQAQIVEPFGGGSRIAPGGLGAFLAPRAILANGTKARFEEMAGQRAGGKMQRPQRQMRLRGELIQRVLQE